VKFKEVVAAARKTVTRASRTVMRTLGIKSDREGEAPGAARLDGATVVSDQPPTTLQSNRPAASASIV
jgi:hypothetical protein